MSNWTKKYKYHELGQLFVLDQNLKTLFRVLYQFVQIFYLAMERDEIHKNHKSEVDRHFCWSIDA